MEENKKRKRVANFTADEKSLLIQLIKKRPVIESKEIDGKSILKKKMAWNSVTDEFNSNAFVHKRDTVTLKRAWDNLKAMARKTRATERGSIIRTGDGPSDFLPISQQGALINMIEEVAPTICEINNSFDSDGTNSFSNENKSVLSQSKEEAEDIHDLEDSQTSCIEADVYFEENTASDEVRELCSTTTSKDNSFDQARKRKPSDYIRREGVMRIKHFEVKKKIELQILKTKLENQEIKKRAAEMEEERNKILLDKAKLEYYEIKKRLGLEQ